MSEEGPLSPYLRRLPIGERLPLGDVANDELFPLEGEILVRRLEPPIIPEPKRRGEAGIEECWNCANPDTDTIWHDDRWLVRGNIANPHGLPAVAVLLPRAHHDLRRGRVASQPAPDCDSSRRGRRRLYALIEERACRAFIP